ncbi:MAG: ParB/RepB/Spo0J family partition protein [Deltaproteobacteria bacterium]|nr:ParB/RepB/Spo0J family partition protein [Deltaproteobacteria bacterium]
MALEKIQLIKLDQIDRPVHISRELIDPEKIRELAESIRESTLLQPVLLRPSNGRFEMVAGDRRYLAHKLLGLKEIKAIVRDLDDRETVVLRGIENLQRENLSPSEEGKVYLALKEEAGLSMVQISKKTGRAQATVARYINFARFPEEIRRVVDKKIISLNTLETLQEIEDPVAFDYHFKMAAQNGITAEVARLWVDDYHKTQLGTYYSEDGGVLPPSIEMEQKPIFITCEVCLGPCEIKVVRNLTVCPECRNKVKNRNVKTA